MTDYSGPERRSDAVEVAELRAKVSHMERDVQEVKRDVKDLLAMANQTKGGWKTIVIVAGVAGSMGAFLAKILPIVGVFK